MFFDTHFNLRSNCFVSGISQLPTAQINMANFCLRLAKLPANNIPAATKATLNSFFISVCSLCLIIVRFNY
jgi:hypothetical protein